MRFIIMHKTNAHWESGAIPSRELIARVGTLRLNWTRRKYAVCSKAVTRSRQAM